MKSTRNNTLTLNRKRPAARALFTGITGAMLALTGCAAELDFEDTLGEPEIIEHSPEILAELETDDGTRLTFLVEHESGDDSGEAVVAITELTPLDADSSVDKLRALEATSLEIFLALAPERAEVPALVRDAHEREAFLLGRSAEVREISLADVIMPATSKSSTCDSYVAFTNSVSSLLGVQTDHSIGTHALNIPGNGGIVMASMCNFYSDRVDYKYAQFCFETSAGSGVYRCGSKTIVPDGHRLNAYWSGPTTRRRIRAEPLENYALTVTSFIAIGVIPPVP